MAELVRREVPHVVKAPAEMVVVEGHERPVPADQRHGVIIFLRLPCLHGDAFLLIQLRLPGGDLHALQAFLLQSI